MKEERERYPSYTSKDEEKINENLRGILSLIDKIDIKKQLYKDGAICIPLQGSEIRIGMGEHSPDDIDFIQYSFQRDSYDDEPESGMPTQPHITFVRGENGMEKLVTNVNQFGKTELLAKRVGPEKDFKIVGSKARIPKTLGYTTLLITSLKDALF